MLKPSDVIRLEPGAVVLLDQTRLPFERVELRCGSVDELVDAIRCLAVRGAPALGVAAAMGMALAAELAPNAAPRAALAEARARLAGSRPTAVNLGWALDRAWRVVEEHDEGEPAVLAESLRALAREIRDGEVERCRLMGVHGAGLLPRGARVLTHCNTGTLACVGSGTALGVVRAAFARDPSLHVWVDETRPLMQGARLTAWELVEDGIPHTLIADSAAGQLFARGLVDAVVFGADRIARNGDVANKVGSYTLSVLARAHDVPCYVVAPTTTIDAALADGGAIPIEERPADEIRGVGARRVAPAGSPAANPAFDVTPAANLTAIVTECGVHAAPYERSLPVAEPLAVAS